MMTGHTTRQANYKLDPDLKQLIVDDERYL